MQRKSFNALLFSVLGAIASTAAGGDAERGAELYPRACAACHSLQPGDHRTGPSLAGVWERKAGSADGFRRYSPALTQSELVWDATTLDRWLKRPAELIPGNWMSFPGIDDAQTRADLIAYLQSALTGSGGVAARAATLPDLKILPPGQQVKTIGYCGDTYRVTTYAGTTQLIWEFNLRFKSDSSPRGPRPEVPVLLRASMMGDRFFIIFSDPQAISEFIQREC